jgi:hypothetical protein
MTVKKQVRMRIAVGVIFLLVSIALGTSSLLGAYSGSPEPWTTNLCFAIALTSGIYFIKSATRLRKSSTETDSSKKR